MDSHVDLLDGSELHDMCARWSGGARAPYSSPDSGAAPPGIPVDFFGQLRSGPDRKLVLWNAAAVLVVIHNFLHRLWVGTH